MSYTAGIDVGSTYTKAAIVSEDGCLVGTAMLATGFKLDEAAEAAFAAALRSAGVLREDVAYVASTGYGRYQVPFRDVQVTDLTAQARGAQHFFPGTRTVLDVGGQTMKAIRVDERSRVRSFRLNDKCAAGTGAFLEKTARYLGYRVEEIGGLVTGSGEGVSISGVCAVFAESEVINHISAGASPGEIMHGAMRSLVQRSAQLLKRVQMEPELTLVGGIARFPTMARVMAERLAEQVSRKGGVAEADAGAAGAVRGLNRRAPSASLRVNSGPEVDAGMVVVGAVRGVNVPPDPLAQFTGAVGAALLARRRLEKLGGKARVEEHAA